MSEPQSRPVASRGRGSGRGGRGGLSRGGGGRASNNRSAAAATNGDSKHDSDPLASLEDQGEIGQLKAKYGPNVPIIKEMFQDWSEVDILYALKETDGDASLTAERIAEGTIAQWGEVSNQKKDRTRSKAKETFTTTTGADAPSNTNTRPFRGGRNAEGGRGRGRSTDRGGRSGRGRPSHATTNGSRLKENQPLSVPTEDSSAWDNAKPADTTADDGGWDAHTAPEPTPSSVPTTTPAPAPSQATKSNVIPQGTAKTWASMLRQSTAPKPAPKPAEPPVPKPEPIIEPLPAAAEPPAPEPEPEPVSELPAEPPQEPIPPVAEKPTVVDESRPPVTETVVSEAADSWDPRAAAISATATPLSASQAAHQPKPPASGFATTAQKATERHATRTPSHQQRRFLDQQEAVRMPGNREVDRAAVQFGAFSLNGAEDDIDGDREEPETRAQPPADSPVIQPRASLPPAPPAAVPEPVSAPKPVVTLPPAPGPTAAPAPPTAPAAQQPPAAAAQGSQPDLLSLDPSIHRIGNKVLTSSPTPAPASQPPPSQPASQQFGRFGPTPAADSSAFQQKPFDAFNQQANPSSAQSNFDTFPSQQQSQPPSQQPVGAFSSAANDYSSYYTADQQSRPPYNYYGQNYGQQQAGQGQQDSILASRAAIGGYGASQSDLASQYPQSANPSRFGATTAQDPASGNTTPNPSAQGQQQAGQNLPQSHGGQQQQQPGSQLYNHPYYGGQFYANYMNHYGGYGQGGYGQGGYGPYGGGKGGLYGQPHQYGLSQQSPYDHGSSPATGYPQSSLHRADSGLGGSGLGDYGRVGSAQSGAQPGLGSGGFGAMHDTFGRGSSYGSQAGQSFNAPSSQPGGGASGSEDLKPFGDGKAAPGPSPSLGGAARPGSATNANPSQAGLPPPQTAQQNMGYGGYPSHLQGLHGNQSGTGGYGMGAGSGQAHQNSPYSGYGAFNTNSYYGQQPRHSGWGNQYGAGNNYS